MIRLFTRSLVAAAMFVVASGALGQGVSFNPASLDFGVLPPKTKKQLPIQATVPSGVPCTLTKPIRFTVTPDKFTGSGSPVTLTVEFDNSSMPQQEQEVGSAGFVEVKCGSVSGKFNVKGALQAGPKKPVVELKQSGLADGDVTFTVQGDPDHPNPQLLCGLTGGGGGAFGATGSSGFTCGDKLSVGSVARFEVKNSTRFLKFTGGTGAAAACNDLTSKICTFTVTAAGGAIVAEYKPPDPKFRVRVRHEGDGKGTIEGTTLPNNARVIIPGGSPKVDLGIFDAVPNMKIQLKASPASGSSFLGFQVTKPSGVTCPAKSHECVIALNPATLEYEIEVTFKKGASAKGSN